MKKIIKKILFVFAISMAFFLTTQVKANEINEIDMDVYIDSNGNASITEVWKTNLTKGTEGYRSYANLGNSTISNFKVSDDSGKQYTQLGSWNSASTFQEKAYKNGIGHIYKGVELCWGISKYGKRTYTLQYDISNFVTQYTDAQGIYFNFINLDQKVKKAKITIHCDKNITADNAKIWAFGYKGTINFKDNKIVLDSGGTLKKSQYMVALVKFEENLFNTANKLNTSFESVRSSAMEGAKKNKTKEPWGLIIFMCSSILLVLAYMITLKVKGSDWIFGDMSQSNQLDFGTEGNFITNKQDINYWREVPCDKDIEMAYWVCLKYDVITENTLRQGIIGAILLKWLKNGYITISKTKKGLFNFKDNNYAIDFNRMTSAENEIENELFKMLLSASGMNKILEAKEFAKWCQNKYYKIKDWFELIEIKEEKLLEQKGLITIAGKETAGMFGKKRIVKVKKVNPKLKEEGVHLIGLRKFLLDYSMIAEREHIEVHIWEEYLIFAQLLGIADRVKEQFSKLYPDFSKESILNTDIDTLVIMDMARMGYTSFQQGERIAAARSSSSYDGGGGSSFSGGGSSSGGSSGGGFR